MKQRFRGVMDCFLFVFRSVPRLVRGGLRALSVSESESHDRDTGGRARASEVLGWASQVFGPTPGEYELTTVLSVSASESEVRHNGGRAYTAGVLGRAADMFGSTADIFGSISVMFESTADIFESTADMFESTADMFGSTAFGSTAGEEPTPPLSVSASSSHVRDTEGRVQAAEALGQAA